MTIDLTTARPITGTIIFAGTSDLPELELIYATDSLSATQPLATWSCPLIDGQPSTLTTGNLRFDLDAFTIGYQSPLFLNATGQGTLHLTGYKPTLAHFSYTQTPNITGQRHGQIIEITPIPVPEPGSTALLLLSVMLIIIFARKRFLSDQPDYPNQ